MEKILWLVSPAVNARMMVSMICLASWFISRHAWVILLATFLSGFYLCQTIYKSYYVLRWGSEIVFFFLWQCLFLFSFCFSPIPTCSVEPIIALGDQLLAACRSGDGTLMYSLLSQATQLSTSDDNAGQESNPNQSKTGDGDCVQETAAGISDSASLPSAVGGGDMLTVEIGDDSFWCYLSACFTNCAGSFDHCHRDHSRKPPRCGIQGRPPCSGRLFDGVRSRSSSQVSPGKSLLWRKGGSSQLSSHLHCVVHNSCFCTKREKCQDCYQCAFVTFF